MIALAKKYGEKQEVIKDFSLFGLSDKEKEVYAGAENFGAKFKRCSILKEVPTIYSNSSTRVGG